MRMLAIGLAGLLSACGGSGEPENPTDALRAESMAQIEQACADHRGVGKVLREDPILAPDGVLIGVRLLCQCKDGRFAQYPPS